jgi:hypothetical protein
VSATLGGMSAFMLSALFGTPWLLGIAWVRSKAGPSDAVPPSAAESARRRLWTT